MSRNATKTCQIYGIYIKMLKMNPSSFPYLQQQIHTYICIYGCVHVCIHMHTCSPDGGRATLGERWGSSIFVDQSQGQGSCSGPCSRWMEASDGSSLAGCSIPAGPHGLTVTHPHHHPSLFYSHCPQGPVQKTSFHWDPFLGCVSPHPVHTQAHMLTHCSFAHTSAAEHSQAMLTSELMSFWRGVPTLFT